MQGQINPKIVGATIIGFALVAGAYTISNFGQPQHSTAQPATVQSSATTPQQRVAINVTDNDNNGIEDWRDEFVTSETTIPNQATSTYTPPDTLTGKMSINLMEEIIRSRGYGAFGRSQEEIIESTVDALGVATEVTYYDTSDIDIMPEWEDQDIVNYANTAATTLYRNSIPELDWEVQILNDMLRSNDKIRIAELESLATVYQGYRDDTLKIPVPSFLAKEHLDLINTYHALHEDIKAMTLAFDDPAVSLLRLKRYQDDATALGYAFQNMYLVLEPHAGLFTVDDPAVLFAAFSPIVQN